MSKPALSKSLKQLTPKVSYWLLLGVLSLGCFNAFATSSFHPLFKLYGLVFCLQGGIALVYLNYQRDRRVQRGQMQSTKHQ